MYYDFVSRLISERLQGSALSTVALIIGFIVCAALGYFLGSINTSLIISGKLYKTDIRSCGSGNAGATNMLRTHGKGAAALTFLGDGVKTAAAVILGGVVFGHIGAYIAGLFCIIGHIFPVYFGFKGGKGVVCAAVAVGITKPVVFCVLLIIFLILVIGTRYVSLGSVIAVIVYPLILFKFASVHNGDYIGVLCASVEAALIVWKHRENIKRINNRTESKISFKKKNAGGK